MLFVFVILAMYNQLTLIRTHANFKKFICRMVGCVVRTLLSLVYFNVKGLCFGKACKGKLQFILWLDF
ncbi:hypothetical protein [Moraxella lacunata]|uniref:hypothetical protein n=1 Tax=Moraxella lacunata TaxID=477 RepID=UPI003EE07711